VQSTSSGFSDVEELLIELDEVAELEETTELLET